MAKSIKIVEQSNEKFKIVKVDDEETNEDRKKWRRHVITVMVFKKNVSNKLYYVYHSLILFIYIKYFEYKWIAEITC